MSNTFQRCITFATFFLSLFCGSLVCTALVTDHWLESKPWRKPNPSDSSGRIYFGLLRGRKELNVAFGLRPHNITVSDMIEKHPQLMSWSLWFTTFVSTSIALICTGLAAFLAVVNTVSTPRIKIFSVFGICLINLISFLMCLTSTCTWSVQFYTKLYENVLTSEDLDNFWMSKGTSVLGFSFWLVPIAGTIHLLNIILIKWSTIENKKMNEEPFYSIEEKSVGAIMLY